MSTSSVAEIWKLHVEQGESAEAARMANGVLSEIETDAFSNYAEASRHGEYARLTEVTSLAAAKKSRSWVEAREHLMRSVETVLNNYPLANNELEAKKRGNYWEAVYGDESAQLICLRDVLHLMQVLAKVLAYDELGKFVVGLANLLTKLSDEKNGERFGLIFLTEEAAYKEAQAAYKRFITDFGLESKSYSPDQLVTVTSRFLGRAVETKDFIQVGECLNVLLFSLRSEPKLRQFIIKELAKNLALVYRNKFLDDKYQAWSAEAAKDDQIKEKINQLLKNTLLGLGQDKLGTIS